MNPENLQPEKDGTDFENRTIPSARNLKGRLAVVGVLTVLGVALASYWGRGPKAPEPPRAVKPPAMPSSDSAPAIPFADIAQSAGVDARHFNGATGQKLLPEAMGGGAAFFDYDNDGDPDLLLLSGVNWPGDSPQSAEQMSCLSLYQNDGGSFHDVTAEAGLKAHFYAVGVAVGDVDGDNDDDLFLTAVGKNHLYLNQEGRFQEDGEILGEAGASEAWTTSAGFFDYDRDGDLDLFVCNYIDWSKELDLAADYSLVGIGRSYGPPFNFGGTQSFLYENREGGFVDVSQAAGIQVTNVSTGVPVGKALAVTFNDVDHDGWIDILVANDTVRNFLFRNLGNGTFEEQGQFYGFAYDANGGATGAMGIDTSWFRNNDDLGIAIGNFANEMSSFYVNQENSELFTDEAIAAGIGGATRKALTFGLLMEDFDLDGRVDLVQANGHLEEDINLVQASQSYKQPAQFFWNAGTSGRHEFVEVPGNLTGDLAKPIVGRGLASADIDADGDLDLVLTQVNGPPLLLRNDQSRGMNWLECRLVGKRGNPHAIGAVLEITAGDLRQRRTVMPTRSFLSQSEPFICFGLGKKKAVDQLKVIWPDGSEQVVHDVPINKVTVVSQVEESFDELANTSKALLENGRFQESVATLEKALDLEPDSTPLRRNLARAYMLGGNAHAALQQLKTLEPNGGEDSGATQYLKGVAYMRLSDYEHAKLHLERAAQLAPGDATVRFQLATALLGLGETSASEKQFDETARLDPLHGGAKYQLAILARKAGDQDRFRQLMRDYERIRTIKGETTTDTVLLEACTFTKAEDAVSRSPSTSRVYLAEAHFRSEDARSVPEEEQLRLKSAAVLALNPAERYQLAAVDELGKLILFECDSVGNLTEVARADEPIIGAGRDVTVIVGNAIVDSKSQEDEADDWPEIAIVANEGTKLFRYSDRNGFQDLTAESSLSEATGTHAIWIDLEHDGDIDLCVSNDQGVEAWRNNGDGTFQRFGEGLKLDASVANAQLAALDLEGTNTAVSLIASAETDSVLAKNLYSGKFATDELASAAWPPAERVVADDFDNNGEPEVIFISSNGLQWFKPFGRVFQDLPLEFDAIDAVATIDYNNDGYLDLAVAGRMGETPKSCLLQNLGDKFSLTSEDLDLTEQICADGLLDLDIDGDGDTDLLALSRDAESVKMINETVTPNRQIKLSLHSYVGQPSSIGTRVQVRREDFLATRWTNRELPIEIGIGRHSEVDSIQTLWGNGVIDNQIHVAANEHPLQVLIFELVRTGSCPFLYAYLDGEWQFVTDLLGTSPLNVAVGDQASLHPDPDETVILGNPDRYFHEGQVRLRVTSEMREAIYLDQVRLRMVNHPRGTTLFSSDRLEPYPATRTSFYLGDSQIALLAAKGTDGIDRTTELAELDHVYAPPGPKIPQVIGAREPLSVELEFAGIPSDRDLLLALTGWLRFGSSSNNIAASQRDDVHLVWPKLEVQSDSGVWQPVDVEVGLPTGNTKTIVVDLTGKIPPQSQRLRLTTSFEVSWDQIALYEKRSAGDVKVLDLLPATAEVAWFGFSELRSRGPGWPESPDARQVRSVPRWQGAVPGWCTRYGDVVDLVRENDERMAIFNSGDSVELTFDVPAHLDEFDRGTASLALTSRGWIKEGDPNSYPDQEIEPFPGSDSLSDAETDWQLKYNTRWVSKKNFEELE